MSKQEVLDAINKIIVSEYGNSLTMDCLLTDSELDSLGMTLFILQLDAKFNILKDKPADQSDFDYLGIETLTIRYLVHKCVLSSTPACTEQKKETDTSV